MNVAVIGAGGTGSAAARFLARDGHAVTVYERFDVDHDSGSSYGGSRIIRRTYADPLYTRLMNDSYRLWEDLEREAGEDLFIRCGGLTFGREDNPAMAQTEDALRVNGVPYTRLTAAETGARFPALCLDPDQYAIHQADGGFLRASRAVRAQVRLATERGAALREGVVIRSVTPAPAGRVRVTTDSEAFDHDRVLAAAGPWMGDLFPALHLPLTVTRQTYVHIRPAADPDLFAVGALPVWIDVDVNMYGFPQSDDVPGVKIAWHAQGTPSHPDSVRRTLDDSDRRPLREYAARRLPRLTGPITYEKVCLYTNTPTEDFLLDAVPGLPGAFLCSGCSGHGFKFTPLLGRILADLAEGIAPAQDLTRFALGRL